MNIYKISQYVNSGYDTYDSAVVYAESEDEARKLHPSGSQIQGFNPPKVWWEADYTYGSWADKLDQVEVQLLGQALSDATPGVICASFNAG